MAQAAERCAEDAAQGDAELVVVGRLGAAHGVRGWLRVNSFTDPPDNLLRYRPWSLQRDGAWQAAQVEATERHGGGFLCRFAGVSDRTAAETLRGAFVGVPGAALPPLEEGEYYWRDLIGLDLINVQGVALGRVVNLMETGANDALVARHGDVERLVPFVAHVVREVDLARRVIVVDWEADF